MSGGLAAGHAERSARGDDRPRRLLRYDARDDLLRLYGHLIDRATCAEDLEIASQALAAIEGSIDALRRSPFICRKAGDDPLLRELLTPFGHSGYVARFEIDGPATVTVLAVRHQREDGDH